MPETEFVAEKAVLHERVVKTCEWVESDGGIGDFGVIHD